MAIWDDVVPLSDQSVYRMAGYGRPQALGRSPALLIIDVTYGFVGFEPLPVEEAVRRWPKACGRAAHEAVKALREVLQAAREAGIPVVYTVPATGRVTKGSWVWDQLGEEDRLHHVVAEIAPREGERVMAKPRASAFFGTALCSELIGLGVDTVLITGGTTSGCVRATAVDGYSYGFRTAVVADACFDRSEVVHKVNLFDLSAKYAEVLSVKEALSYLQTVASRQRSDG